MYGAYGFHQVLLDQEKIQHDQQMTDLAKQIAEAYAASVGDAALSALETVSAHQKKVIRLLYTLLSRTLIPYQPLPQANHKSPITPKDHLINQLNKFKKELLRKIQAEQARQ